MKIAVASGKGGTGKTMVATSLAATVTMDRPVRFLDCDVEAPNAHLFLHPTIERDEEAVIPVPEIIPEICTLCGRCVEVCTFHALAKLGTKILVFPQLCHGCGSCSLQCPVDAITEKPRAIGRLSFGMTQEGISFGQGELTISEPMPTPVIRQLKAGLPADERLTILDSPPGASCSVVTTLHDVDFVLLVTEPTAFGLHDLRQMLGILQKAGTPAGVIINRAGAANPTLDNLLREQSIPILMCIPYRSDIAAGLASGQLLIERFPEYKPAFIQLLRSIESILAQGGIEHGTK
jgi:MinD superfamily P-loop ATPase